MSMSKPLYIKSEDIPGNERVDTQRGMICKGIEKVIGKKNLKAAQKLGRKWILNTIDEECRNRIITVGRVEVGRVSVAVYATDPFAVLGPDGKERETTKLIIDGVPLQEGEEIIRKRLEEIGVIFCAKDPIKLENHFDVDTKSFSDLLTGRRYAYIVLPNKELPKTLKIGPYMARLYYRQMVKELPSCRNCDGKGHWTNQCPKPKLCYDCKQPGHRKGDEACPITETIFGEINRVPHNGEDESDQMEEDEESAEGSESEGEIEDDSCHDNSKENRERETEIKNVEADDNLENTFIKSVDCQADMRNEEEETEKNKKADKDPEVNTKKTESDNNNNKENSKNKREESRGRTQSSMTEFVNRMRSGSRKRELSPQQSVENGKEKGGNKKAKKIKNEKKKMKGKQH